MPKITQIDKTKADKRDTAVKALKARPLADEKSVANLRERMALYEAILGLTEQKRHTRDL